MNRREGVLALLALGAVTASLRSGAQTTRVPRVGVLGFTNLEQMLGFFREGLRDLGYIEGKNILLEIRSAEGKPDLIPALAAELVGLKVDIIVASFTQPLLAAKKATSTIPIVMAPAGDPVGTGLIASLARPGGNITGVSGTSAELAAKNIEIVRDIRPKARRVGVLANVADPFTTPLLEQIQNAGKILGIEIRPVMVRGPEEYDGAFAAWAKARVDAVFVQPSLPTTRAIELALKHRLLTTSFSRPFVEAGGLFAYTPSNRERFQRVASYIDRILKGAKPADLPVEQPTLYELVINLKTAKAIGLKIPQSVLIRAHEVIE